jgi:hypothetical protein
MRSVALFFFYAFMEESVATAATHRALRKIQKSLKKESAFSSFQAATVYWTEKLWRKYNKKAKFVNLGLDRMFTLPKDMDLEPWRQLQKEVLPEERLAAIWSVVLQFSHLEIAEGLGVSAGTVQHRTGIALNKLSSILGAGKQHGKKRN